MEQVKEGYLIDCISGQTLKATPEEVQAVQPFAKKLMEDYGYPVAHIQTRPQWHVKVRPSDVKKEYPVDISSPIVKQQIRVKQFTQDIIDTLGRRIMELELPIPKDKATQEQIPSTLITPKNPCGIRPFHPLNA